MVGKPTLEAKVKLYQDDSDSDCKKAAHQPNIVIYQHLGKLSLGCSIQSAIQGGLQSSWWAEFTLMSQQLSQVATFAQIPGSLVYFIQNSELDQKKTPEKLKAVSICLTIPQSASKLPAPPNADIPMYSMASMNQELMSVLWLSSTGMHLYWKCPSKWFGQSDETFSKAVIPNASSISLLEA